MDSYFCQKGWICEVFVRNKTFIGCTGFTWIIVSIRMSFIGQVCLHIRGIFYSDISFIVQQNDNDRTGHRQQKNNIQKRQCTK